MPGILIPVDGSKNSDRAVQYLVNLIKDGGPMEVHVLNVQEPVDALEVKRFWAQGEIDDWQRQRGAIALRFAREQLDGARVPYAAEMRVGDVALTIADYAKQAQCDLIVMGTRGMGTVGNLLLGSVATKVIHLVDMPVTLVK